MAKKKLNLLKLLTLGIGINYLLINIPLLVFCKYGYTGLHVGVKKRTAGIGRAMPGFPFPIFFVITPFAYQIEQIVHWLFNPLRANFYKGDGHTETYFVLAVIPALLIMCALWAINIFIALFLWRIFVSL